MYRIPRDSPLRYLPLVYFLPVDLLVQCPTLCSLPRCFSEVASSETHIDTIHSDQFFNEITTITARMVFPHFGLRGWLEHYTGYCPAWIFAYSLPVWVKALEDEIGWGLQSLFDAPKGACIPFFDSEYIREAMRRAVQRGIAEQDWQPILDLVREMPCDEDFEPYQTNIRKDFLRKWYHTRAKTKMVSLEACMEDGMYGIHEIGVADNYEDEVFVEDFKAQLSEKDMAILELRLEGYTYEEIADKLGYANHSGVIKRMRAIKEAFFEYESERQ